MKRGRAWILFGAIVGGLVLGAAPVGVGAQQPSLWTRVRVFAPFGPNGLNPRLAVAAELPGACAVGSAADAGRPDAWRCTSADRIYDPCFHNPYGDRGTVACATDPWSPELVLLTLTEPLPPHLANTGDVASRLPWALELVNADRCLLVTGASAAIAGMRVNYQCSGGEAVIGDVDRGGPLWRVFVLPADAFVVAETMVMIAHY